MFPVKLKTVVSNCSAGKAKGTGLSGTLGPQALGLPLPDFSTKTTSRLTLPDWVYPGDIFFLSIKACEAKQANKQKNPKTFNVLEDTSLVL